MRAATIYAIGTRDAGPIKVGVAADTERRLAHLQVGYPKKLRILYALGVARAVAVERGVHRRLAEHRLRGEWFKGPLPRIVSAIDEEVAALGLVGSPVELSAPNRPSPALEALDNALARYLKRHHIPAARFATRLGVSRPYFHLIVSGARGMSFDTAAAIVRETDHEVGFEVLYAMTLAARARK